MKTSLTRKWSAALTAMLLVTAGLVTGCSGINATKSVSPLDFLLPGLMQNDTPAAPGTAKPEVAVRTDGVSAQETMTSSAMLLPANANLLP